MATLKREEIEAAFYEAVMASLGYDQNKDYGSKKPPVRLTYPAQGQPDWGINDDVVFILFGDADDDSTQTVDETWENSGDDLVRHHKVNRVLQMSFVAYGPNGYDNLVTLRHKLMDNPKQLKEKGINVVPSGNAVTYAPEIFQGLWWQRADLQMTFNSTVEFDEDVRSIATVDVHVNTDKTLPGKTAGTIIQLGSLTINKS